MITLTQDQIIGLISAGATILVGVISWFVSAWLANRSRDRLRLTYSMKYERILPPRLHARRAEFTVQYQQELLPDPVLLIVDITNTGNVAVVNPPLEVRAVGATYVIPGWIDDMPPGYDAHWQIERTDAESCALHMTHINPGQTARVRFLLDEYPSDKPQVVCPMPNLVLACEDPHPEDQIPIP